VLLESQSAGLNANSQITRGKGNKVYYSSDEEEDRDSQPLKVVIPLLRENVCFLKGFSGAQVEYMTLHGCWSWFSRCLAPHLHSCVSWLTDLLLWWSGRNKGRLPGSSEE
jgi:hypothetical protein